MRSTHQILVIDDQAFMLEYLKALLESKSYIVHTVSNEVDAIRIFKSEAIQVIISDLHLDGTDSKAVEKENWVKEFGSTPIIWMSGEDYKLDCQYFITKPFGMDELHKLILSALNTNSA